MNDLLAQFGSLQWEPIAVLLAIGYLLLAIRESHWCWWCAFVSSAIYAVLLWHARLYMEAALSIYYMVMAVYGWQQWQCGGPDKRHLAITTLPARAHVAIVAATMLLTLLTGTLLARHTDAAWPYLDATISWASVLTTWLVARKVLENWLYWLVIDSVSIVVYLDRGLHQTAALFAVYLVLAVFGLRDWHRTYRGYGTAPTATLG